MLLSLRRNNNGMTVVEVVVTITFFCAALLLMAPRVSQLLRPNHAKQECLALKETLENLVQRSAYTGLPYIFIIDMDSNTAWGIQTDNALRFAGGRSLNDVTSIENVYDTMLRFGPEFKFLDVDYADTVKFENGLVPIRFVNGTNEHVLLHMVCGGQIFTMWLQPFIAQVHIYEGYLDFDEVYYREK